MIKLAEKFQGYGFEKNMGYGTARHLESILNLGLTKYHRKTFYHIEEPTLFSKEKDLHWRFEYGKIEVFRMNVNNFRNFIKGSKSSKSFLSFKSLLKGNAHGW